MSSIYASVACNLDANMLMASIPLFESEKVQAVEWSFDTLFKVREVPAWFIELLHLFGTENRLIGHGVFFSLFSGRWSKDQQDWLAHLKQVANQFQFAHITEHFGFMTGENFHQGAPINVPFSPITLSIGQDRLKRIYESCHCPVGLENLAFSYSLDEVKRHGEFLNQLLEPINGFIILDLHNLYCQLHNFDMAFEDLIQLYPLEKVREIHISGGSWENSMVRPEKQIRRDTHDDRVPQEVFELLKKTIPRCKNLKFVVLEQLGVGLKTNESKIQFQEDFYQMEKIVAAFNDSSNQIIDNEFYPKDKIQLGVPIENNALYQQQMELSDILESATNYEHAAQLLKSSSLVNSAWNIEKWAPEMVETVMLITQKWKNGFE